MRVSSFLLLIYLLFPHQTYAAKRIALIIGNSNYISSPLKNPVNDARDMAGILKKLGFGVILKTDASKRGIEEAMNDFYFKLRHADVGFFFYAGHGMQIDGENYLIPLGANLVNASDVRYNAVPAGLVLGKMDDAGNKLNIVVLDACRDNPFRSYFRSNNKGLAFMDAPNGTIIAYATSPGSLAADGLGRNGLYTGKLLENIMKPDLNVLQVFNQTGLDVREVTDGRQTPWLSSSPLEPFYLAGGVPLLETTSQKDIIKKDVDSLKTSSEPSGVKIFNEGSIAGAHPVKPDSRTPDNKTNRVEKANYTTEEKQNTIHKGWITVSSTPSKAQVRILNINPRYNKGMALDPGKYHIEVSANGYETERRWVNLAKGELLDMDITLQQVSVQQIISVPVSRPQPTTSKRNFTDSITGMQFVHVKGGCYQMGDSFGDGTIDETPVHKECLDDFYIGKYEVTQKEYKIITNSNPAHFKNGGNYPIENISWNDIVLFLKKYNSKSKFSFRLPTEAEWEYAARSGGKNEKYSGSDSPTPVAWYNKNSGAKTHPVGNKSGNGFGLFDMSGNVYEWCFDDYKGNYDKALSTVTGKYKIYRGGSWFYKAKDIRTTNRAWAMQGFRSNILGFRIVASINN